MGMKMAQNTDLMSAVIMDVDEVHLAFHEVLHGLHDEVFWAYPLPDRHNICTIAMHVLQQHDDINKILYDKLGGKEYVPLLKHEKRFHLWGLDEKELPKDGDEFPSPEYVMGAQERVHKALLDNLHKADRPLLESEIEGPCPTLIDLILRGTHHAQAHLRQMWYLRGKLHNSGEDFPSQYYA